MSLKSFDKLCERMILGEPGSQKEILDERQKIVRTRVGVEALTIFSCLTFINALVMDLWQQWAESYAAPMLIFFMVCIIYFNFRCFFRGALIGINGGYQAKFSAIYAIFMGLIYMLIFVFKNDEEKALFSDGKLTDNCCFLITLILFIIYGITGLVLIRFVQKSEKEE